MRKFIKSFGWARKGLVAVWKEERNFRIQVAVAVLAIIAAYVDGFVAVRWVFLILVITLVLTAEIVNTVVEDICDKVEPERDAAIGKIKDMMAGYVLVSSAAAVIVGLFLFLA